MTRKARERSELLLTISNPRVCAQVERELDELKAISYAGSPLRIATPCRVKPRMMLKDGAVAQLSVLQ